ncbi:MAG TPA: class I SAM-dependent methyltransferase [Polyangiaceae bacterium]
MSRSFKRRERCTLCAAGARDLAEVMSLAPTPPANEFLREDELSKPQDAIPLTLLLCGKCGHLQLAEIVDPERLFRNYVYVSGTSPVFVAHFREYAKTACERFGLGGESFVVEVGSNDGTLLKQFQGFGVKDVLGVDPASEIVKTAVAAGVPTLEAFFTTELAKKLRAERRPADLVCANNVFAHAEDLGDFARAAGTLLGPEGVFVFEVSYLRDVIEKLLFDTIYHEHTSYHALAPLVRFFEAQGMRLFDAERVESHGGSIRCFVCHANASHPTSARLRELLEKERELGLESQAVYVRFKQRITERGARLRSRLGEIRAGGERVAGFGAPAKLTTLMHEFGLGRESIDFICDDSAWKQGRYTPGTHIPVVASSELGARKPAWCVVFAWNFADSIVKKHDGYAKGGGHFIVPLPELREI